MLRFLLVLLVVLVMAHLATACPPAQLQYAPAQSYYAPPAQAFYGYSQFQQFQQLPPIYGYAPAPQLAIYGRGFGLTPFQSFQSPYYFPSSTLRFIGGRTIVVVP